MATEQKWAEAFSSAFMQPCIEHGDYFEVETTVGTEIVPTDVVGSTVYVSALLDYLEGKPLGEDAIAEVKTGWLARLWTPGFPDCTAWTAHATEDEAKDHLIEMYGDDE